MNKEVNKQFVKKNTYYDVLKSEQDLAQGASLMSDEPNKWELEVNPFLERVYNDLLGNIIENGAWVRDLKRRRIMNELGASEFIQEVASRISIHQQLSELTDKAIIELASWASQFYADKLEDNFGDNSNAWELSSAESNLNSVGQRLYDILYINLNIAREGGMKTHRERARNPYMRPADMNTNNPINAGNGVIGGGYV